MNAEVGIKSKQFTPKELGGKKPDYLSWDEYFMGITLLSRLRSKDPATQTGACVVDKNNKIISIGYNGAPIGLSDEDMPWKVREGVKEETKYPYICHGELNAIISASPKDLHGAKMYSTVYPCNECAKLIIQSGIKEVLYLSNKHTNDNVHINKASEYMFRKTGVKCTKLYLGNKKIVLDFSEDKI
ncbi:MAG: dCMP deaminase family protein [Patescibacteria group bacterium]|nr:dCMP deaminase family protein [Patescibacteria group bacterium]